MTAGLNTRQTAALPSTLLPTERTDRVYNMQLFRLKDAASRCLGLSAKQKQVFLYHVEKPGQPSLPERIGQIKDTVFGCELKDPLVTIDEVDEALHHVASRVKWSAP